MKFKPENHIIGKAYDLTQENMQAMLIHIDKLEEDEAMFLSEHDENVRLHFENVDLKEQNARLRDALESVLESEVLKHAPFVGYSEAVANARAALEGK